MAHYFLRWFSRFWHSTLGCHRTQFNNHSSKSQMLTEMESLGWGSAYWNPKDGGETSDCHSPLPPTQVIVFWSHCLCLNLVICFFLLLTDFPGCSFCHCVLLLLLLYLSGLIFFEEKGLNPHIMRNWLWHVFPFLFQRSFPIHFLKVSLNANRFSPITPLTPEPDLTKHFLKTRWLLFKDSECIPVLGSLKHTAECVLSLAWIITPAVTF